MAKKKNGKVAHSRVFRSVITVIVLAALMGVSAGVVMKSLNTKMGIEPEAVPEQADTDFQQDFHDYSIPEMPGMGTESTAETGASVWVPEWKLTPCSLYISTDGTFAVDSLPQAPGIADRATELQLLMELWAGHYGFTAGEVERVWAFARNDSCFIDLPAQADWGAVVMTVENRFMSYTVLFPFVSGELVSGYDDGIPVRGIAANR